MHIQYIVNYISQVGSYIASLLSVCVCVCVCVCVIIEVITAHPSFSGWLSANTNAHVIKLANNIAAASI